MQLNKLVIKKHFKNRYARPTGGRSQFKSGKNHSVGFTGPKPKR